MAEHQNRTEIPFLSAFKRPAWVVMMVAQMLLGLALFITLILKYYMLVIGTDGCLSDSTTLGNMIRCTDTLEITAHFVFGVAAFRFAAFMFEDRLRAMLGPLMVALLGMLLLLVSGLTYDNAAWSLAAIIVTLMVGIGAIYSAQIFLRPQENQK